MIELTPEEEAGRRRRMYLVGALAGALMLSAITVYFLTFDLVATAALGIVAMAVAIFFGIFPELVSRSKRGWRGW